MTQQLAPAYPHYDRDLRDKIDKPFGEQIIKTVYGVGYTIDFK